jgi:hypothetical protein
MNTMTDWWMKFNNCYTIEPGKGNWRFKRLIFRGIFRCGAASFEWPLFQR